MRLAKQHCKVPCCAMLCCDSVMPLTSAYSLPHAIPGAQSFLSMYFYFQANSISHLGSAFCPLSLTSR